MSARDPASAEAPSRGYITAKARRALSKAAMISTFPSKFLVLYEAEGSKKRKGLTGSLLGPSGHL